MLPGIRASRSRTARRPSLSVLLIVAWLGGCSPLIGLGYDATTATLDCRGRAGLPEMQEFCRDVAAAAARAVPANAPPGASIGVEEQCPMSIRLGGYSVWRVSFGWGELQAPTAREQVLEVSHGGGIGEPATFRIRQSSDPVC